MPSEAFVNQVKRCVGFHRPHLSHHGPVLNDHPPHVHQHLAHAQGLGGPLSVVLPLHQLGHLRVGCAEGLERRDFKLVHVLDALCLCGQEQASGNVAPRLTLHRKRSLHRCLQELGPQSVSCLSLDFYKLPILHERFCSNNNSSDSGSPDHVSFLPGVDRLRPPHHQSSTQRLALLHQPRILHGVSLPSLLCRPRAPCRQRLGQQLFCLPVKSLLYRRLEPQPQHFRLQYVLSSGEQRVLYGPAPLCLLFLLLSTDEP
mmetsp:Transcript_7283/g.16652  ORF Transcript_7283/g.16652 Transcript_7283/m.16652 type:complete len:258 (-) Transcript_7283:802-1575(-)